MEATDENQHGNSWHDIKGSLSNLIPVVDTDRLAHLIQTQTWDLGMTAGSCEDETPLMQESKLWVRSYSDCRPDGTSWSRAMHPSRAIMAEFLP